MEQKHPFSKFKKAIDGLFDENLKMEFCCISYPLRTQWGHNPVPRFYVKLGKEIIWDYPKDFKIKEIHWSYWARTNGITDLIREYIDTPVNELLTKNFVGDKKKYSEYQNTDADIYDADYKLTEIFIAADRRLGKEKLLKWAALKKNPLVDMILAKRYADAHNITISIDRN